MGAVIVAVVAAIGIVGAVIVTDRLETGKWSVPDRDDFVRIEHRLRHEPSRTIFLEQHAVELVPGDDDAPRGMSSVLAHAANRPVRTRGWTGGAARWKQLVACMQQEFAPFDVEVTDQRPAGNDFILVAIGGRPGDIGVKDRNVTGLAPFDGDVIDRAVVFGFSASTDNDPRVTCETIAMEVGHAYGLDHEYLCRDVMTYLPPCGPKSFVDRDVSCGEAKKRACETGKPTQNSFRHLLDVLGAHRP